MKIVKVDTVYDPIYPFENHEDVAGFQHFEKYCIKCHSINRIGGNVGPDFNDTKNITEYWDIEHMWAYAKNPQSFRYNAHMAPIEPLTREEFDRIVEYLRYISAVKPNTAVSGMN